jgi:hypothetical protein
MRDDLDVNDGLDGEPTERAPAAPQGEPVTVTFPGRAQSAADLREELRRAEERERQERERADAEARERERIERAVDAAVSEAHAAMDDVLARFRALLPGAERMAGELDAAEARALATAREAGGQFAWGTCRHRLAHPVQKLRALLDTLSDDGR